MLGTGSVGVQNVSNQTDIAIGVSGKAIRVYYAEVVSGGTAASAIGRPPRLTGARRGPATHVARQTPPRGTGLHPAGYGGGRGSHPSGSRRP